MAMAQVLLHSSSSLGLASLYVNTRAIVPTPEQVRVSRLRSHNCMLFLHLSPVSPATPTKSRHPTTKEILLSSGIGCCLNGYAWCCRTPRLCVASRLSKIVQGAQISLRLRVSPNLSSHQVRSPRFHLCTTRAQMDEEAAAAVAASTADSGAPTIFDKIISKQIPSTVVYEDDKVLAFEDVNPQAPVHIVLIPKKRDGLTQLSKATEGNKDILGHLLYAAKLIADQEGLADGFRVVINDGANGCQSVYHLHLHILGGRKLKWPPG